MNRIRLMRVRRGLTLQQLSARVDPPASYQQIARLERDERRLTWDWLMKIARALDCAPMDLIEDGWERLSPAEQKLVAAFRDLPEGRRSSALSALIQSDFGVTGSLGCETNA
ncbi:MAG: helix-turn-helix transcriptional regulator [Rhodospirillales bacterium]|nr:helix-turn-helix transcriptional regulator [Rhodospirillales bacterium]